MTPRPIRWQDIDEIMFKVMELNKVLFEYKVHCHKDNDRETIERIRECQGHLLEIMKTIRNTKDSLEMQEEARCDV